jgi:DME family drug/metabolite transporter
MVGRFGFSGAVVPVLGLSLVCLAAALWGTVGVARGLTRGVAAVDPAVVGLVRTALGATCLLAVARAFRVRDSDGGLPVRPLLVFGAAGAVFQVSLFEAFARVGVTATVAITVCAPPLIVALGEAVHSRRAPEAGLLGAILVASVGVVLLVTNLSAGMPSVDGAGVAAVAAASVAFSLLAIAARVIGLRLHPLRGAGLGLASTAAVLSAVVAATHPGGIAELAHLGGRDLAILAYIGVAATGGAYLFFVLGMRCCATAGAGLAATMLEPLVAALLAAALLDEHLDGPARIGGILTLAVILLLFLSERRSRAASSGS